MKNLARLCTITLLTLLFLILISVPHGVAQPLVLKLGHGGLPGSVYYETAAEFGKRVNEKLGGKAKVDVYGSGQLGNDVDLLKKVKLGTVELSELGTVMSNVSDYYGFFELPYLVKDRNHLRKIREEVFWSKIAPTFEKPGYKILGLWENGFRHITTNIRPIYTPADLKGIKLRVPRGVWRFKMFKAYGANPTPLAYSEVFMALQTGVIDGQENPLAQIWGGKFFEVQKYMSLSGHVYNPTVLVAGMSTWESLPADIQKVIKEVALEVQEFALDLGEKMDNELLEKMVALRKGQLIVNDVDKDSFIKASDLIYEEFEKEVPGGKELIQKALALGQ